MAKVAVTVLKDDCAERLEAGLICFGRFDGENLSLAAAVHGNRVLVHTPHTGSTDEQGTRSISIRQEIVALTAGARLILCCFVNACL